jgi:hypothetical protein
VRGDAVVDLAHIDCDAVGGQVAPYRDGIIGLRETGLLERSIDLAGVDVERASHFDIAGEIAAEIIMHQADGLMTGAVGRMLIEFQTLEQGGCTVAYPDYGDPNLRHFPLKLPPTPLAPTTLGHGPNSPPSTEDGIAER